MILGRVHPAETASNYIIEGFIKQIIEKANNFQNHLLKYCSVIVIPILNPDGVEAGLTWTDLNGINLNDVYD